MIDVKKNLGYLIVFLLIVGGVFYFAGTMTITEQNKISDIKHEFMGTLVGEESDGKIFIAPDALPSWCEDYGLQLEETVILEKERPVQARAAIFMDFVQMEERITVRNLITGNFKSSQSRVYYVPEGQVSLELVYDDEEMPKASFDHALIVLP